MTFSSALGKRATLRTTGAWYDYSDALDVDGSLRNDAARANAEGDAAFGRADIVFTRALGVRDVSLRQEVTFAITPSQTLDAGVDAHLLETNWGWSITARSQHDGRQRVECPRRDWTAGPARLVRGQPTGRALRRRRPAADAAPANRRRGPPGLERPREGNHRVAAGARDLRSDRANEAARGGRPYTQSPGYEKLLQSNYFVDWTSCPRPVTSERARHLIPRHSRAQPGAVALSARVELLRQAASTHLDHRPARDPRRGATALDLPLRLPRRAPQGDIPRDPGRSRRFRPTTARALPTASISTSPAIARTRDTLASRVGTSLHVGRHPTARPTAATTPSTTTAAMPSLWSAATASALLLGVRHRSRLLRLPVYADHRDSGSRPSTTGRPSSPTATGRAGSSTPSRPAGST